MIRRWLLLLVGLLVLATLGVSQDKKDKEPKLPPGVDREMQEKIDKAVEKGVQYLKGRINNWGAAHAENNFEEFVLWTLLHAGVSEEDEVIKTLLDRILKSELKRTYSVALQAMCLRQLDRKRYQMRIAQCAQFLVDNQCENGQWGYGAPVPSNKEYEKPVETPPSQKKDVSTEGGGSKSKPGEQEVEQLPDKKGGKTEAETIKPVKGLNKRQKGPPTGDNSNSQYAALGLKACYEAGIILPTDVIQKAKQWWEENQNKDGGWGYRPGDRPNSFGSMTAGAIASLCIYRQILRLNVKENTPVKRGLEWLATNFTVKENPRSDNVKMFYSYYLYALERAGGIYGTDYFGGHKWYKEGADHLLSTQHNDGYWSLSTVNAASDNPLCDTCFAILFLRRHTRPVEPPKLKDVSTER